MSSGPPGDMHAEGLMMKRSFGTTANYRHMLPDLIFQED